MTHRTPCADPANDPQDWFIRSDGKQYSFEDLLTDDEIKLIGLSVLPRAGETFAEHEDRRRLACNAARNNRRRSMLARRRRAVSLCWSDCPLVERERCFAGAIERVERHGTWGGHTEEQWTKIHAIKDGRRLRPLTT